MSNTKTAITPTREENYAEWYQKVIEEADLSEHSVVRGCMVIKPWGYALWENIQKVLDQKFKDTGHANAYFPLLIPLSFLEKEAEHVEGFAKECAVVTHHRLEKGEEGKLVPAGKLDEPFVIRPTSETIIGHSFSKWVQSYRDLPILINQWANIMRWEMRTRLFLRTSEFLWQEGHTAHATEKEAEFETMQMLDVYEEFCNNYLAIPVLKGQKTQDEKFPGAVNTYTIEAIMQDGKALQCGTSHYLGQNFAKSSGISFLNKDGIKEFAYTTSWGVTTRLIGALIMVHSDDDGLVLPPRLAPVHVFISPIFKTDEEKELVLNYCESIKALINKTYAFENTLKLCATIDKRDLRGGDKMWQAVKKGYPIRLEIGPRDVASNVVCVSKRSEAPKTKNIVPKAEFLGQVSSMLETMQNDLYQKALRFRDENIKEIKSLEEFKAYFKQKKSGLAKVYWHEDATKHPILSELKITPRCIPLNSANSESLVSGTCIFTGKPTHTQVLFGASY